MKTSMNTKLQTLVGMMIFGLSLNVGAAGNCSLTTFQRNVTSIKEISPNAVKVKQTMIPDTRTRYNRTKVDSNSPYYGSQGIGKVTTSRVNANDPNLSAETIKEAFKKQENSSFGTGFLMSPCHVLTNYHVICEKELINGELVCKENQDVLNKPANFSFFENSNGNYQERVTGNVVVADQENDYSIIRIDSLKNKSNVPFLKPDFNRMSNIENVKSWVGGYSNLSLDDTNSHLHGTTLNLKRQGPYLYAPVSNPVIVNGNSGGPAMYFDGTGLIATGLISESTMKSQGHKISVSRGTSTITALTAIGNDLSENNPALYQEILNAINTGKCE